jgi:ribosomal protein L20A (L18A)
MADKLSLIQISESMQHIGFLKDMPDIPEDERAMLEQHLLDLSSRQEAKFDSIIGMVKKCDSYIEALGNELDEIKANLDAWKKNREKIISIIKFAYQQELIGNTPTGIKYQATIRKVKPRLVDNFDHWDTETRKEFGLRKTTTITRIKDESVVEVKQEELPDKDRVREALASDNGEAPVQAQLIPGFSFTYERRKRLTS